jgi:hypothetical protein
MTIRKDDPAYAVKGRPAKLDKKGTGAGETDIALNGQCPPGQYIEDQMEAEDTKRIARLKPKKATDVLKSGTCHLD